MRNPRKAAAILIILVLLLSGFMAVSSAVLAAGAPEQDGETRSTINEGPTDQSHNFVDAKELQSGDIYYGHLNKVDDKSDFFKIDAAQQEVVNIHIYVIGHDGGTQWLPPNADPPTPGRMCAVLDNFIYSSTDRNTGIDGAGAAVGYLVIRNYVLNICAPVPGTNTYYINVSVVWYWTPNNATWDYFIETDISQVPTIVSGGIAQGNIDLDTHDTHWFKILANKEDEINGSFEIRNFNSGDPTERNINFWIFPDNLGGYPFSYPWDWSAAPNEPIEPISILSTYSGWFFLKLRGVNHTNNLPCSYKLEMYTHQIPVFPDTGLANVYFDRFLHDTDWYKFTMKANQPKMGEPGLWNEVRYFNMTERADAEDLPDFDLYLFGLIPGGRFLDLLDSSFRNDHPDFNSIERDPNKNTEEVRAAAFYNGTYYLEVNDWNNTGFYDVRWESWAMKLSDVDNLPGEATVARAGVYESYINQAFDHYDWYKVEAERYIRVQFDSFKPTDLFNASIYKYDAVHNQYVLIAGGWNTWYNFSTRQDNIGNLVDVKLDLVKLGLGQGTYFICVYAAIGAEMATDPQPPHTQFVYKLETDAEANYEIRVWIDDAPPFNRAPQVIKIIQDVTVDEDTDKVDALHLYDFFRDTDVGDAVLRFKASLVIGKLKRLFVQDDVVGFQAQPDYSGKVQVKVSAIDRKFQQTSLTWNITFQAINDPPRLKVGADQLPYVYNMPEDAVRQLDFKNLVNDVDLGDKVNITFPASQRIRITLNPDTLVADVVGADNWFGEEVVTFVCTDLSGAKTDLPIKFTVQNVEDNPLILKQIGEVEINEDNSTTLSMAEYFVDPDGDRLTFSLSSNLNVEYTYDPDTMILTLTPEPDWYGFREIWITTVDSTGRTAQQRFNFIVDPVNDKPEITRVSPADLQVSLKEETSQSFVVLNVTDPEFSILIYNWYLDGRMVGPSNFYNFKPSYNAQGTHELRVTVTDEEGLSDAQVWTVTVIDVPRPAEGGISSPPNNGKFTTAEKVPFFAFFYDLDGDAITYQWYVDGRPESTSTSFSKKLGEGKHEIRLAVTSGDTTVPRYLNITVQAAKSPGFEAPFVVAGMGVGFMAAAAWGVRRRRL